MNITLRQLEVFCRIARHGNVSRAAEDVLISQSAASMALAELERQLGEQMFDRLGKKIVLNDNGRRLLPVATEMLDRACEIEGLFQNEQAIVGGTLMIGASSTIGNYLMPALIGGFSATYPDVKIHLKVSNTERIIEAISSGDVDIGFVEGECRQKEVDHSIWRSDELVIFSAATSPFASSKELGREQLLAAPWVLREKGSGTREVFERALGASVNDLQVHCEFGHTEAVKGAVRHGLGIGCLSRLTIQENLEAQRLVELHAPFLDLRRDLYQLLRRGKYQTACLRKFIEFARTHQSM